MLKPGHLIAVLLFSGPVATSAAGPDGDFSPQQHVAASLGPGYAFHIDEHCTLAPELFTECIDGEAVIWIAGVSIGCGFRTPVSDSPYNRPP